jgi:LuxR family maltose regulon positive regulatory protein
VIAVARRAFQSLPAEHLYVRGALQTTLVMAMQATGDAEGAVQMLQGDLARVPRTAARAHYRLRILLNLLSVQLAEGNIAPAEQLAATLLHEAIEFDAPISQLWAHLALGLCAYETNDLVRAADQFARGAEFRQAGHVRGGHECLVDLALTYQALGRTADAHQVAALLADYHWQMGNPQLTAEGVSLQVHLAVLAGQVPGDLARVSTSAPLPAIWFGWTEIPAKTRVHALLATATPSALAEAEQIVDDLLKIATAIRKPRRIVEFLALKASVQQQRGQRDEAWGTLEAAIALTEPRGLVRALVDAGPQLEPLLRRLAEEKPSSYLERLLAALPARVPRAAGMSPTAPARTVRLTRREREVLALLAAHLTDREIAEQLVVSPLTVRTHIEHIGEKLDASGRRAIVAQAIQLGLLA